MSLLCLFIVMYSWVIYLPHAENTQTQRSREQFPLGGKLCILFRDIQIIQCTGSLILVMGSINMHLDLPGGLLRSGHFVATPHKNQTACAQQPKY